METECITEQMEFQQLGRRAVIGRFNGGIISSDGGAVLLREVDRRTGISEGLARCFRDYRKADRIEHSVLSMIRQRVCGIALGYEDLNDHDRLRYDVVMGVLSEKDEPSGTDRMRKKDQGKPIAGKSTLNRLELTPEEANEKSRYKKIVADGAAIDELMVEVFIESYPCAPSEIVLDIDATDDPLHGHQEGRYFHGYYAEYCYLPLYIFCGEHLLCARLRPADKDPASADTFQAAARAWAATMPAASVARLSPTIVDLRSCDPGPAYSHAVPQPSAFKALGVRSEFIAELHKAGLKYTLATCATDGLIAKVGVGPLLALNDITDPKTLTRVGGVVRDVAFAPDGTLYLLDQTSLVAVGQDGTAKWTAPLVDGRRLVTGQRVAVLDGTDRLLVFAPADGTAEELGVGGTINDVTMSRDGRVVGAIVDSRRAVLFTLP